MTCCDSGRIIFNDDSSDIQLLINFTATQQGKISWRTNMLEPLTNICAYHIGYFMDKF